MIFQSFEVLCAFLQLLLRNPSVIHKQCSSIQGRLPKCPIILLFHVVFTKRPDISWTVFLAYPWMCHDIEIWGSTCAGETVRASGTLPSHLLCCIRQRSGWPDWHNWRWKLKDSAAGFIPLLINCQVFYTTGKIIGYMKHISTCCFIFCCRNRLR